MEIVSQTNHFIALEEKYGAHNYHPLPIVIERGSGIHLYDVDGNQYLDFLAAYSAANQGHCHPRIIQALIDQVSNLTLTSRAFYNDKLGIFEKYITQLFGYDKFIPMNTGVEAVETGLKLCRKWASDIKLIPQNEVIIGCVKDNFHGRTFGAISLSTDPDSTEGFGPFLPGFVKVEMNNFDELEKLFEQPNLAGFLVEPIQGEAGVIIPQDEYIQKIYQLCKDNNVLFIADEVQTGLGRTGKMLACDFHSIRPDVLILGKALSGGILPVSGVLADNQIMLTLQPGQHGSTYGGNPLACVVAMEALQVIIDEYLVENSAIQGQYFRNLLQTNLNGISLVKEIRGRGLMNAIEIHDPSQTNLAWKICIEMSKNGLLAKPTHHNIIRFTPPCIIQKNEIEESCQIITEAIIKAEKMAL